MNVLFHFLETKCKVAFVKKQQQQQSKGLNKWTKVDVGLHDDPSVGVSRKQELRFPSAEHSDVPNLPNFNATPTARNSTF